MFRSKIEMRGITQLCEAKKLPKHMEELLGSFIETKCRLPADLRHDIERVGANAIRWIIPARDESDQRRPVIFISKCNSCFSPQCISGRYYANIIGFINANRLHVLDEVRIVAKMKSIARQCHVIKALTYNIHDVLYEIMEELEEELIDLFHSVSCGGFRRLQLLRKFFYLHPQTINSGLQGLAECHFHCNGDYGTHANLERLWDENLECHIPIANFFMLINHLVGAADFNQLHWTYHDYYSLYNTQLYNSLEDRYNHYSEDEEEEEPEEYSVFGGLDNEA